MKPWHYIAAGIITWLLFIYLASAFGEEQPPHEIRDPEINENFRRIYQLVDQIRQNDGANIIVSSRSMSQFDNADVYGSSVTLAANVSVIVAVAGLKANWLPIFTEIETSSKTVSVQVWPSSFTLTNTSGSIAKTVNWWVFGRK